jgi:hypothetical protein
MRLSGRDVCITLSVCKLDLTSRGVLNFGKEQLAQVISYLISKCPSWNLNEEEAPVGRSALDVDVGGLHVPVPAVSQS